METSSSKTILAARSPSAIRQKLHALDNLVDHFAVDLGEALAPALVKIAERVLIESELVQDRRVNVADVVRVADRAQSDLVGRSHDLSAFHPAPRHPHA